MDVILYWAVFLVESQEAVDASDFQSITFNEFANFHGRKEICFAIKDLL